MEINEPAGRYEELRTKATLTRQERLELCTMAKNRIGAAIDRARTAR